ncbi:hypothetical protein MJO28_005539 [Puccinia striiformis f. sp. tritici]|uniref:Uncharacterized protein n=1 Tax=Puccinia striiformis f. sp. tritici TaxID=168172 RepID=A0ACC0EKZ2_9BASI|nr:hypothetical protein MJO28_005539 [Puccinia striiformis f. sp. tritici]
MDVDLLDQPSENVVGLLDSEDDVHSTASSVKVATLRQPLSTTGSDSRASHWIDLTNNSIHDRTLPDPEDAMDEDQQSNVPGTRDLMNVDQQSDMPSEDEDNHQPSTTLRRSPRNRIVNFSDCNNDEDLRNAETNQEECSDDSRNNESEESDYSNEREWVPIAAEDPDSSYTNGPAPQRDVTTRNPAKDSDTNTNKPDLTTLSTAHLRRLVKSHGLPYSRITRDNLLILCESFSQQQQPSGTRSGQTFRHQVSDTPSSPPADFDSHPDGEAGPDGQQSEKHNNISCQAMHRRTAAEIKDMKKTQKLTLAQLNETLRVVQQLRDDLKKKSTRGAKARGKLEGYRR